MADRRERKRLETRTALLQSALALVKQRGIYGTRVEDITERADVGKGVFYNYFDSKDAVIAALLSEGVDLLERDYMQEATAAADTCARLEHIVWAHERFFSDHPEYSLLFHQARGVLQLGQDGIQELHAVFARYIRFLAEAIDPSARGASAVGDALLEAAVMVAGAIAGYRSFCLASDRPVVPASVVSAVMGGVPSLLQRASQPLLDGAVAAIAP